MLLAVAPPAPVAWWPGSRTLPESVLRRLPRVVPTDRLATLRPSGVTVVAIPVDGGRPVPSRRAPGPVGPVLAGAPWGEPLAPFAGVTVTTCQVPRQWLRPETIPEVIAMPLARTLAAAVAAPLPPRATITQFPRQPRPWPTPVEQRPHGRFRRVATLALGLLISFVAVEAAARTSRH